MSSRVVAWGVVLAFVGGLATVTVQGGERARFAALQEETSSVLDGVFTGAQARRGRRVYNQNCASCHGSELKGGEMAPSIAGNDFIIFWTELPVGSLFERIKVSMPEDGPGRLSDEEYTDVVAYMLSESGYPSGDTEMPADKEALDGIMIVDAE